MCICLLGCLGIHQNSSGETPRTSPTQSAPFIPVKYSRCVVDSLLHLLTQKVSFHNLKKREYIVSRGYLKIAQTIGFSRFTYFPLVLETLRIA